MRRRTRTRSEAPDGELLFHVEGMHCASCGLRIDDRLEDVPGVARARTSFRSASCTVYLAPGAVAAEVSEQVLSVVHGAGYRALPATAGPAEPSVVRDGQSR